MLPNRLLLIIAPILCAFSFGVSWVVGAVLIFVPISCAIGLSFPEYPYLSCCSTFQSQIIVYLLLLVIQSSHFFAIITVALFVVVPRLSASTLSSLSDLGSLPLFRLQSWFCSCCLHSIVFLNSAFCFLLRPMFSDLSLRITQSRRNVQQLAHFCLDSCLLSMLMIQLVFLFSVCYFVLALSSP